MAGMTRPRVVAVAALAILSVSSPYAQALRGLTAAGQGEPSAASSICGVPVRPPGALPMATSGPVVYLIAPCFERQGGRSRVDIQRYLNDIKLRPSSPTRGLWIPYDATAEKLILEDFQRLWANEALADLSIDVRDFTFSNGVVGKLVTYNIIERN